MSIFKEVNKYEPVLALENRELHRYRLGFQKERGDNWQYNTVCNATYDDIADEVTRRLMIGFKGITVKIMDEE